MAKIGIEIADKIGNIIKFLGYSDELPLTRQMAVSSYGYILALIPLAIWLKISSVKTEVVL
jgi:hypothetical protein